MPLSRVISHAAMATSKPYSYPTDDCVDSVDTLLGGARALLKSSGEMTEIMTAMSQNAPLALSLQYNRDLHCIEHDSKTYYSLSYVCIRKSTCRVLCLLLHSMIIIVVVAIVACVVLILAVVT